MLPEIPNQLSISNASQIFEVFEEKDVMPEKITASVEGGVLFEFFINSTYCAIELSNGGEVIRIKRPRGEKSVISEMQLDEVCTELQQDLSYGD